MLLKFIYLQKQKISFIVNPFSGTSSKNKIDTLIEKYLNLDKYNYDLFFTKYAGHASEIVQSLLNDGTNIIVAVGGDGTVNEVISLLIDTDIVVGIIPAGSGNGFASHLGLSKNIKKSIDVINKGIIKTIDTCTLNGKPYINVAGLGFDAKIAFITRNNTQRGILPYLLTTIGESFNFSTEELIVEIDGKQIKGRYALAAIANASMYGYHFTIAPSACIDDGFLDIMLLKDAPVYKYFFSSYRGFNKTLHKSNLAEVYRGRSIKIKSANPIYYHMDGEGYNAENEFEINVIPTSLKILVPSSLN